LTPTAAIRPCHKISSSSSVSSNNSAGGTETNPPVQLDAARKSIEASNLLINGTEDYRREKQAARELATLQARQTAAQAAFDQAKTEANRYALSQARFNASNASAAFAVANKERTESWLSAKRLVDEVAALAK